MNLPGTKDVMVHVYIVLLKPGTHSYPTNIFFLFATAVGGVWKWFLCGGYGCGTKNALLNMFRDLRLSGILVYHSKFYFLDTESLTEPWTRISGNKAPKLPSVRDKGFRHVHTHSWLFTWVLRIQIWVLMFSHWVIYPALTNLSFLW